MPDKAISKTRKATTKRRVKNEEDSKTANGVKVGKATEHTEGSDQSLLNVMAFDCECDRKDCGENIQMSTDEYEHVHCKLNNFVVVPNHVQPDIEKVVVSFSDYCIVEKLSL